MAKIKQVLSSSSGGFCSQKVDNLNLLIMDMLISDQMF